MLSLQDVIDFLFWLGEMDSVKIEENQNETDVTLNAIKSFNSGNNCLHYILMYNNHRIVIQTYKNMNRKSDIDIVQGKPELEPVFDQALEIMNQRPQDYTDEKLNKLFVLYCGLWSKWVTSFYWGEMDAFCLEFGSDMSLWWSGEHWLINADGVWPEQLQQIIDFINAVEDICR
jgi:hypothetical protein